jgi:deoxyxylulose-5-phosphate synthase
MIPDARLKELMHEASRSGAREALHEIGLSYEGAAIDVHELKTLLTSWRAAKQTVQTTITRVITTAILGLLVLGAYTWFKDKG